MADNEAYSLVGIKYQSSGAEKAAADAKGVTAGLEGVGVASDNTTKATERVSRSLETLQKRYDTTYRAQQEQAKALRDLERARGQGLVTDERAAQLTSLINQRYNEAAKGASTFANSTGLARHELVNLSRQAQDVVVSLAGGQGLGTVMLQQGSQIIDVLGTSRGGIRGAVSELATSFRGLFTVGRVAFAGIATAVGGAAYSTASYLSEQKSLERSLTGNRMASPGAINRVANDNSSLTGLSVSETREAAAEFARTGQIHSRVIGGMIETTKNFALVTGQSSKEAAAALAGAFTNMQGIDNLNKQFNFLDGNTRRVVENLLLAGRTTEAVALANDKLGASLKSVEETQGGLEKGWTAIANAVSNFSGKVGEGIAKLTGLQRSSKSDRANELDELVTRLEGQGGGDKYFEGTLQKYKSELAEIRKELSSEYWGKAFNALSASAQQAIAATDPLRGQLDAVIGKLTLLKDAQAAGVNLPGLQMAVQYYEQIAQHLQNQMQAQDALMAKYPGMTAEFAKQVESIEQQNRLLKARQNGNEASVSAAIAYERAIADGANSTEAAAIKALTLKNNLLQAGDAAGNITLQLNSIDWSEFNAYDAAGGHRPDTVASGEYSYLSNNTFGNKQFQIMSNAGFALYRAAQRAASAEQVINGALSGGVNSALSSLTGTQFQSVLRGPSGSQYDINNLRSGFGSQSDITNAVNELFGLKLAQAGNNTQAKEGVYREQLAWLETQPMTIQNMRAIVDLKRAMEDLTNATEANTAATVSLNPLYNGRDALKVGYFKAAKGLSLTAYGPSSGDQIPFHAMVNGGEKITITPAGQTTNDNSKVVNLSVNLTAPKKSTSRRNARQYAQGFGQMMAELA